jgi:uncharacterized protein (TIGR02145 family)
MKTKNRNWLFLFLITGVTSILIYGCSGSDEDNNTASITDKDGNVYTSVNIGTQVWMVENLKTTKYNDGTGITLGNEDSYWTNAYQLPAYCWYNDDITNKSPYGALYNYYAVNTGKLCPTGWHVASDTEWHTMILLFDHDATQGGDESQIAGANLKEAGITHWFTPNTGANNSSGFTALPGGFRTWFQFNHLGEIGYYWSSHVPRLLYSGTNLITRGAISDETGCSVRCVKD